MTDPLDGIDLSVVIPVFRSELTLPTLTERLSDVLEKAAVCHEIVFVDDGSPGRLVESFGRSAGGLSGPDYDRSANA